MAPFANSRTILSAAIFFLVVSSARAFNITRILNQQPEFSVFNGYLTQTGLDKEINKRSTISVLAVANDGISALTSANLPADVLKRVLMLHVILDYFDPAKLQQLEDGTALLTTLYQTSGMATAKQGFLNATDNPSTAQVNIGSAIPGSSMEATIVRSVFAQQYNISVMQISAAIVPPGFTATSSGSGGGVNVTSILLNAGLKQFATLLQSTGTMGTYQDAEGNGLTVFAPKDQAFATLPGNLTASQKASLVLYHAVSGYHPVQSLKQSTSPLTTLAATGNSRYQMTVNSTSGTAVALQTGFSSATIVGTILDQQPIIVYTVDAVLKPLEIFAPDRLPPPPPPAPIAPPPKDDDDDDAPSPAADAPAPSDDDAYAPVDSPLASPADAPSPADSAEADAPGPAADVADDKDSSSRGDRVAVSFMSLFAAVMALFFYLS